MMQIGFIGLGKMGAFMVERLLNDRHEVVVYNRSTDKIKEIEKKGATGTYSVEELVSKLTKPK
ncbi:MAG: NAD(P)-binding domain-containing protein, partial [bacterium]